MRPRRRRNPASCANYASRISTASSARPAASQSLASIAATTAAMTIQATYAAAAEAGDGRKYPYHYQIMFNTESAGRRLRRISSRRLGLKRDRHSAGEHGIRRTGYVRPPRHCCRRDSVSRRSANRYTDLGARPVDLRFQLAKGRRGWRDRLDRQCPKRGDDLQRDEDAEMVSARRRPQRTDASRSIRSRPGRIREKRVRDLLSQLHWTDTEQPGERQSEFAKKLAKYPEAKGYEVNVAAAPYYDFSLLPEGGDRVREKFRA